MCDPVVGFALSAGSQVMQHQAQGKAVDASNRAKLKNFKDKNRQYRNEVMFDNAEWKNDVQAQDIEQDEVYMAMISQWSEQDQQLDQIFAKADQNVEKAIREMYSKDYAGTQTGRTAARLAGKSAKELGFYKAEQLHSLMMAKETVTMNKETARDDATAKGRKLYEQIRFSPIHGPTPEAPELDAKPGMGGLLLGIAGSAFQTWGTGGTADALKGDTDLLKSSQDIAKINPNPLVTPAASSGGLNIAGVQEYMGGGSPSSTLGSGGLNIAGVSEYTRKK